MRRVMSWMVMQCDCARGDRMVVFRDVCVAAHASGNGIGDEGATALASALERNSTLQHLDVGRECRGDAGVCVVWRVRCVDDDAT